MPRPIVRPAPAAASTTAPTESRHPETRYVGRFAPTPSGALHWGSVLAACVSWLDARAAGGHWYLRIDDLDRPRVRPGAETAILRELERLGLEWDGAVQRQQGRETHHEALLETLQTRGMTFPCGCTRAMLKRAAQRHADGPVYPGTCRPTDTAPMRGHVTFCSTRRGGENPGTESASSMSGNPRRALRFRLPDDALIRLHDRQLAPTTANATLLGGDFIIRRADGPVAFVLAGIADDEALGVTHLVRGHDLLSSTLRQQALREALGLAVPATLHHPLWLDASRRKLSKSQDAAPTTAVAAPQVLATVLACLPGAISRPTPGPHPEPPSGLIQGHDLGTLLARARRATRDDAALVRELLDQVVLALQQRRIALAWPRDDTQIVPGANPISNPIAGATVETGTCRNAGVEHGSVASTAGPQS